MDILSLNNREDFVEIFRKYNTSIFRYIYLRIRCHKETAQDLTQEVFVKAWKYRSSYTSKKSSIKNWLFVIAHNTILDFYRKMKNRVLIPLEDVPEKTAIDLDTDDRILYEHLIEEISKLPEKERELLILRYVEDLSITEIADIIGKKYTATKISIYRALKKFKKSLNEKINR